MKQFAYYPGCTLHATAREYDTSIRLVSRRLGLELQELQDWVCCGASSAHTQSHLLGVALSAHGLAQAAESGLPLFVPCALCYSRMRFAAQELEGAELRQRVEKVLGRGVAAGGAVLHPLQVLDGEEIPVARPLAGLRVACYYGCLLTRPQGIAQVDGGEDPQVMDRLMERLGVEAVAWAFKTECCGAGLPLARRDMVLRLSRRILGQARAAGADCIAVACPMCHSNLDLYQKEMGEGHAPLPIFYFSQLVGLALGFSPQEMLLKRHLVDPTSLLREKGLA